MKIKLNKKTLCSLFLTGTIALNITGCNREIMKNRKEKATTVDIVSEEIKTTPQIKDMTYINKYGKTIDLTDLNNSAYILNDDSSRYTLCEGASIYFKSDWNIDFEEITDRSLLVDVVSSSDKYTLVKLPTGEQGYVENGYLVKCPNVHVTEYVKFNQPMDNTLACNAYLYNNAGMYVSYLYEGQTCKVMASNFEYSLITLPDGTSGYVLDRSLTGNYQVVDGYAFIPYGTRVYYDKQLSKLWRITDNEVLYVEYTTNKYAAIFDTNNCETYYIEPKVLRDDFILVDLNKQRMECYLDYQLAGSWGTRSGKDSTPTHTGAYDIDEKVADWEFTTYPGSYAKYWIPISTENQEGIHDLVGDDEQNYGNESYHTYGSHGCIRVPVAASKFVYDNYNIGDMVLVKKK